MTDQTAGADYEVTIAREINGCWREVGAVLTLTPRQAKYYCAPFGAGLVPTSRKARARKRPAPEVEEG